MIKIPMIIRTPSVLVYNMAVDMHDFEFWDNKRLYLIGIYDQSTKKNWKRKIFYRWSVLRFSWYIEKGGNHGTDTN